MLANINANETRGVLGKLLVNQNGNVVAIVAAALIPLVGIIGGGVDISRAYMTKARLQAACDAGALAARRAMTTTTYTTTADTRGKQMFNFNFKPADYEATLTKGATATPFYAYADSKGKVIGTASATIPTTLMKIFGNETMTFTVKCNADFQVPNIDTVLVLDVTGSMADCPDDSNCNSNSSSKIAGLKTAVKSFYDTLETAAATNPLTQLRYGFVPYSQTTNGADLFAASPASYQLPLTQLTDNWTYNSRVAEFSTPISTGTAVAGSSSTTNVKFSAKGNGTVVHDIPISNVDCDDFSNNNTISLDGGPDQGTYSFNPSGEPLYRPNATSPWSTSVPASGDYQQLDLRRITPGFTSDGVTPSTFQICTREEKITNYTRSGSQYGFTKWIYKPVSYNVSNYKAGTALSYISSIDETNATVTTAGTYDLVQLRSLPDQSKFTSSSVTWSGCLEERSTVADATFSPIPDAAEDLDFLNLGTNDNTKWRPIIQGLGYIRNGPAEQEELKNSSTPTGVGQVNATCPVARMQNLQEFTSSQIDTFISTLAAAGSTYHDIGMIWGLRMISPSGMFSSRNVTASNGGQISRNIIFMTDGALAPTTGNYSSYGYERVDQRITGGSNNPDQYTRHARRFQALCDAARAQGISVYTIAFGTSNPSNLVSCADPGRAYVATNTAALTSQFQEIAKSIADLRLTQ
jgi:Flp pilus assembly protein TadG